MIENVLVKLSDGVWPVFAYLASGIEEEFFLTMIVCYLQNSVSVCCVTDPTRYYNQ